MNDKQKKLSYQHWQPAITPEEVFANRINLNEVHVVDGSLFWLENRPDEQGRNVIVMKSLDGTIRDITPKNDWNVRSRVHEYGGGSYTVDKTYVYFVNFQDQRLYKQNWKERSEPAVLTPAENEDGSIGKYAALTKHPHDDRLFFVYEKEYPDQENQNYIAFLNLETSELLEPSIISVNTKHPSINHYDFYADPTISPSGDKIAWIQWNHPNMPWDETELVLADLTPDGIDFNSIVPIYGRSIPASICYPKFDAHGILYFIKDEPNKAVDDPNNWWNIYNNDNNTITPITQDLEEYGLPQWVFGISPYDFLTEDRLVARTSQGELVVIDTIQNSRQILDISYTSFSSIKTYGDYIYFIAGHPAKSTALIKFNASTHEYEVIKTSGSVPLDSKSLSIPELLRIPTADKKITYAQFYRPKNANYEAPKDTLPPLLVLIHGGPTAKASTSLSLIKQYWTSQGYAILDIDYRGSTGYGRDYRDALYGQWGIIETKDVRDVIEYAIGHDLVADKISISGGSAGGYEVQRVLTLYPDLVHVGASYYGIGNLKTLAKLTHKFESKYIIQLVGGTLEHNPEVYDNRSPINDLDKLIAPMILFQGSEDKIVNPENSREIAEILKNKGIKHQYVEYEGETHGFRKKENLIDSLSKQANFFKEILG